MFAYVLKRKKKSPYLLQLLKTILQHCFAVKLHKCFADYKTS